MAKQAYIRDMEHARSLARQARAAFRMAKIAKDTGAMDVADRKHAHALNYIRTH